MPYTLLPGNKKEVRVYGGGVHLTHLSITDSIRIAEARAQLAAGRTDSRAQVAQATVMREDARRMHIRCVEDLKKWRARVEKRYPGSCPELRDERSPFQASRQFDPPELLPR